MVNTTKIKLKDKRTGKEKEFDSNPKPSAEALKALAELGLESHVGVFVTRKHENIIAKLRLLGFELSVHPELTQKNIAAIDAKAPIDEVSYDKLVLVATGLKKKVQIIPHPTARGLDLKPSDALYPKGLKKQFEETVNNMKKKEALYDYKFHDEALVGANLKVEDEYDLFVDSLISQIKEQITIVEKEKDIGDTL